MKNKSKKRIRVIGITGGFAGGKTTVASMFAKLGARPIDADKIYHQLIKPGRPLYKKIVSIFGREILTKNRQIDRKKLAKLVFDNAKVLKKLCQLTHPAVIKKIKLELSKLKKARNKQVAVIDAPLLIEAGLAKMIDSLIVVKTSQQKQISRCRKHFRAPGAEIIKRIKAQLPLRKKISLADYVVDNDGTLPQTRKQVRNIWKQLKNEK